jgi:hypothetical protein
VTLSHLPVCFFIGEVGMKVAGARWRRICVLGAQFRAVRLKRTLPHSPPQEPEAAASPGLAGDTPQLPSECGTLPAFWAMSC